MTHAWCIEAAERCVNNNKQIHDPRYLSAYTKYTAISKNICTAQGVANSNPLNI